MLKYWIWLTSRNGLSSRSILALLRRFPSPEEIYFAEERDYREVEGLGEADIPRLMNKDLADCDRILKECDEKSIQILTMQDAAYPRRLKNIADPPAVLYYKGRLPLFDAEPVITVVGSRSASAYGLLMAKRLGYQIARCGGIVVSGGARGIDSMALRGALPTDRPTVVVLGCGVDVVYPRENAGLFEDVTRNGCLISEYPPGTPPEGYHFPVRNRIMTGLGLGVLVVEAAEKSGTLISAQLALDQGRDVFAVPGNVGLPSCAGSNRLIKEGAFLAENGWDVMHEYVSLFPERIVNFRGTVSMTLNASERQEQAFPAAEPVLEMRRVDARDWCEPAGLTEEERRVTALLRDGAMHIDDLIEELQLPAPRAMALMTLLEMKHIVCRLPGSRYELA